MKNYYYILGLESTADLQNIRNAYKKLSKKLHPDVNEGDKFFEDRFKEIQEAYNTLTDEIRKSIYDRQLNEYNARIPTEYSSEADYYRRKLAELESREKEFYRQQTETDMEHEHMNPLGLLLQLYTNTKQSFSLLLQNTSEFSINFIFASVGMVAYFQLSFLLESGDFGTFILESIIIGSLCGLIFNYSISALLFFIGKLLQGKARFKEIKILFTWLNLPLGLIFIIGVLYVVSFNSSIAGEVGKYTVLWKNMYKIFVSVIGIWTIIVATKALTEIQKFSIWKSALNLLLGLSSFSVFIMGCNWVIKNLQNF